MFQISEFQPYQLAHGSRAQRARPLAPGADSALHCASQPGAIVMARSTRRVPSEARLECAPGETSCRSIADVRMRNAVKETPNHRSWFHSVCEESRRPRLIGTSLRPSGVLLSGTKITRLFQPASTTGAANLPRASLQSKALYARKSS